MLPFAKIVTMNDEYALYFIGTTVIIEDYMGSWYTSADLFL